MPDIDFRLSGAHPRYAREIEAEFLRLSEQYPMARLRSVSLYEPRGHDTSMGATLEGGRIVLNAYWFAGDPDRLRDVAKRIEDNPKAELTAPETALIDKMVVEGFSTPGTVAAIVPLIDPNMKPGPIKP